MNIIDANQNLRQMFGSTRWDLEVPIGHLLANELDLDLQTSATVLHGYLGFRTKTMGRTHGPLRSYHGARAFGIRDRMKIEERQKRISFVRTDLICIHNPMSGVDQRGWFFCGLGQDLIRKRYHGKQCTCSFIGHPTLRLFSVMWEASRLVNDRQKNNNLLAFFSFGECKKAAEIPSPPHPCHDQEVWVSSGHIPFSVFKSFAV